MINNLTSLRVILIACFFVLIVVVAISFLSLRQDSEALKRSSKENIYWSAAQAEMETRRLMTEVSKLSLGSNESVPEDVQDRFEILWSRIDLFLAGPVGQRLRSYDAVPAVIARTKVVLSQTEKPIYSLGHGDRQAGMAILNAYGPVSDELHHIAMRVMLGEEQGFAQVRTRLRRGYVLTAVLTFATIMIAAAIAVQILLDSRRNAIIAAEMTELANAANASNRAKSSFFAMMSHELRTPLNGLLGLVALANEQSSNPEQSEILRKAEASGRQLTNVLGNVIEFSEFENGDVQVDNTSFDPRHLIPKSRINLTSSSDMQPIEIVKQVDPSVPGKIMGDAAQLKLAVLNILETIGSYSNGYAISVRMKYRDGELRIEFSIRGDTGSGVASLALRTLSRSDEEDLTEGSIGSIGLTVAKRIVQRLSGNLGFHQGRDGLLLLWLTVPAPKAKVTNVVLKSQSPTIQSLCKKLVATLDDCELIIGDEGGIDIVLFEAQATEIDRCVKELQVQNPGATLIMLSRTKEVAFRIPTISLPINAKEFQNVLRSHVKRHALTKA